MFSGNEDSLLWWLWIAAGLALLGIEILTPGGLFALFFGAAALVVGALASAGLGGPFWFQGVLFTLLSVAFLLFLRGPLRRQLDKNTRQTTAVDSLVGETAVLMEDLPPGAVGKAELRGTIWSVKNIETLPLPRGQRCRVQQINGLTLWVRSEEQKRGDV